MSRFFSGPQILYLHAVCTLGCKCLGGRDLHYTDWHLPLCVHRSYSLIDCFSERTACSCFGMCDIGDTVMRFFELYKFKALFVCVSLTLWPWSGSRLSLVEAKSR